MTDNIGIARVTPLVSFTVADVPCWSLPEPTDGLVLRWDAAAGWVDVAARGEEAEKESEEA